MGNIVDFDLARKDKQEGNTERKKVLDEFLEIIDKDLDEIMTEDEVRNTLKSYIEEDKVLVFQSDREAMAIATALLLLPEYEKVSHFEIVPNVSRLSVFYKLVPIYKDTRQYLFPDTDLLYGINLININNMKDDYPDNN